MNAAIKLKKIGEFSLKILINYQLQRCFFLKSNILLTSKVKRQTTNTIALIIGFKIKKPPTCFLSGYITVFQEILNLIYNFIRFHNITIWTFNNILVEIFVSLYQTANFHINVAIKPTYQIWIIWHNLLIVQLDNLSMYAFLHISTLLSTMV